VGVRGVVCPVRGLAYFVRLFEPRTAAPRPATPALLVHGFGGSGELWAEVARLLAGSRTVVAVDLPGHGRTPVPPDDSRWRMEEVAADLAALLDSLGLGRTHLVGYSMGGRLALHAALNWPERWASLVLESASPGLADEEERRRRREEDGRWARLLEEQGLPAFFARWDGQPLFAGRARMGARRRRRLERVRRSHDPLALAACLRGMGAGSQQPLWERLQQLLLPVLLVSGKEDSKYCQLAEQMQRRMVAARRAVLPRAGHSVHLERPRAYARVVAAFWQHLEQAGDEDGDVAEAEAQVEAEVTAAKGE